MAKSAEKQREVESNERREDWKEMPENFLRRLTDFAPQRFPVPCPVNRKAGYSFHDEKKEVGGGFVDVSSSLYGTRDLHPRQVD